MKILNQIDNALNELQEFGSVNGKKVSDINSIANHLKTIRTEKLN